MIRLLSLQEYARVNFMQTRRREIVYKRNLIIPDVTPFTHFSDVNVVVLFTTRKS